MESPLDRIQAIKKVREISGLGLYESKQVVDTLFPRPFLPGELAELIVLVDKLQYVDASELHTFGKPFSRDDLDTISDFRSVLRSLLPK